MKKIVPIFLFIIICLNHLNLINAVADLSVAYKKQNTHTTKNFPADEESGSEKENKGKEKIEEEKFFSNHFTVLNQFQLSDKDKFLCFNTALNVHPFQEDDIQPPKAV